MIVLAEADVQDDSSKICCFSAPKLYKHIMETQQRLDSCFFVSIISLILNYLDLIGFVFYQIPLSELYTNDGFLLSFRVTLILQMTFYSVRALALLSGSLVSKKSLKKENEMNICCRCIYLLGSIFYLFILAIKTTILCVSCLLIFFLFLFSFIILIRIIYFCCWRNKEKENTIGIESPDSNIKNTIQTTGL